MDGHADVVQQRAGGDHDLGVAPAHPVVGDHHRLDPGLGQEPQQAQPDVEHDLDVDPGVVRHAEALRGHLGHVPPGAQLRVGVHPVEQRLEPAVATRWGADPGALDRLRGSGAALVRTGGALGFPGAVNAHERSVSGAKARQPALPRGRARVPSGPAEYRRGKDAARSIRLRELPCAPPG